MAGIFGNRRNDGNFMKENLIRRYNVARYNLLLIIILTVINMVILMTGEDTYYLFSAIVPYMIVGIGMVFCGKFPEEFYVGEFIDYRIFEESAFIVFVIIAFIILIPYLLSFIFSSKKRVGWLIFAFILFIIDSIFMILFFGIALESMLDIFFHTYVIISFVMAFSAYKNLKKLPEENPMPVVENEFTVNEDLIDSIPIRSADFYVKNRILAEKEAFGHKIIYRRVKRVNELVIDGNVYDEYVALMERAHMLTANIDGHSIAAGMDGLTPKSYIMIDGIVVAEKTRWI